MNKEQARQEIKTNLWRRGNQVEDVSRFSEFDLFVNRTFRVKLVNEAKTVMIKKGICDIVVIMPKGGKRKQWERINIQYSKQTSTKKIEGVEYAVFSNFTKNLKGVFEPKVETIIKEKPDAKNRHHNRRGASVLRSSAGSRKKH